MKSGQSPPQKYFKADNSTHEQPSPLDKTLANETFLNNDSQRHMEPLQKKVSWADEMDVLDNLPPSVDSQLAHFPILSSSKLYAKSQPKAGTIEAEVILPKVHYNSVVIIRK